ncbi:HD domain-containing protein [Candidatus Woesearchaeota archaeon]|nr:HD domain-containing protein [Candidatus Woesearchaeota archaeon]
MINYDDLAKFLFEAGQLKKVKRSGWWLAGIKDPESVAEHVYRAAILGMILAEMEKADASKVVKMILFHDLPEARVNDSHKVALRYLNTEAAEKQAFMEQTERLPPELAKEVQALYEEWEKRESKEAIIAKDADLLECAIQAKEYLQQHYKDCENWIENGKKQLKTESAKKIMEAIEKNSANSWWYGLKHIKELLKHKE